MLATRTGFRRGLTALALLALAFGVLPVTGATGAVDAIDKVDPWVLQTTADGASTSFLIMLRDQADTSGANALGTKAEKGQYVYDQLTSVAAASQGPLVAYLSAQGVTHRAYWIVNAIYAEGNRDLVMAIAARSDVLRVTANPTVHLDVSPEAVEARAEAAQEAIEWGISNTNAPAVWAMGVDGTGIVVAGEDTGYDWTHPQLQPKYRGWNGVVGSHDYNWHDSIHSGGGSCGANSPVPCDDNGHGTHTMGTMVGGDGAGPDTNDIGMAYGAKWIACRNMDQGNGTPTTYIECHQFMLAPTPVGGGTGDPSMAPHVINNSWGCPVSEGCTDVNVLLPSIQALRDAGIVFVVSAGNSGPACSTVTSPPSFYEPSFSVGAISISNALASFSSRGPAIVDGSNRRKPDVAAPGVNVRSSVPGGGYSNFSGTSMAGPHVAGAVALLLDEDPSLIGNPNQIEARLEATANPAVTATGVLICGGIAVTTIPNNHFGYGRIDVAAAANWTPTGVEVARLAAESPAANQAMWLLVGGLLAAAGLAGLWLRRRAVRI